LRGRDVRSADDVRAQADQGGPHDWPTQDLDLTEETAVLPVANDIQGEDYRGDDWPTEPSTVVREGLAVLGWGRTRQTGPSGPDCDDRDDRQ